MAARPQKVSRRAAILSGWSDDHATARQLFDGGIGPVRAAALGALHRTGALEVADLVAAMSDAAPEVRRRALLLTASSWPIGEEDDGIGATLRAALDDDDTMVLETACFVAGECPPATDSVIARLIEIATGHPEVLCRESAVAALGSLGDPRAADAVIAACSDKPTVRRRAVLALVAFDGPAIDETLASMASDPDWQVRQAAEDLLAIV